ncbi:MAG: hypothetical protein GF331_11020 [Chitinivibrionales bacterium]|nr:hypothetical protein [Chitinivibrionales bacterium]
MTALKSSRYVTLAVLWFALATLASPPVALNRFALVVGSNLPGGGRGELRYAVRDAESFASVLRELGGVDPSHLVVITNPRRKTLLDALGRLKGLVRDGASDDAREEVMFYYSGHADAKGLLLGNEVFEYAEVRRMLHEIPADVHVAVMDACASGAMTRTKGGTRRPAFLFDASSAMEGHAYLTSSSHDEVAQESDQIKGSFFTHYLISGLRGGADFDVDGRVTLNEAYKYAFDETLKRTERTYAGPQHPSYDITLKGSGDLVMTDLRASSAGLRLGEAMFGSLYVRDGEGNLLVEIRKRSGKPLEIGLQPGTYEVTLERPATRLASTVKLTPGRFTSLSDAHMKLVATEVAVARGGGALTLEQIDAERRRLDDAERRLDDEEDRLEEEEERREDEQERLEELRETEREAYEDSLEREEQRLAQTLERRRTYRVIEHRDGDLDTIPVSFEVVSWPRRGDGDSARATEVHRLSLNFLLGRYAVLHGAGIGLIGQWAERRVKGIQASLVGNWCGGSLDGVQLCYVGNAALGDARGLQSSNVANFVGGDLVGAQLSNVSNYARSLRGIQSTNVANVCARNLIGVQMANVANVASGVAGGQLANVANVNHGHLSGIQAANVVNVAKGVHGAQISNVANVSAGDVKGMQLTNVANVARDVNGAQITCVSNAARDLSGLQLALVVNRARRVLHGAQVSLLVNVAEESNGFLFAPVNIVRKGELHPAVYYDESGLLNFTFRSGNRRWYGLLCAAVEPRADSGRARIVTAGLGWGVSVPMRRVLLNADASAHVVTSMQGFATDAPNQLSRVRLSLAFRIFDHLIPFVGASVNLQNHYGDKQGLLRQDTFGSVTFSRIGRAELWPGLYGGIEF